TLTKDGPRSPLYKVWQAMRDRCSNPKHQFFHRYGGRGISVCAEWSEYTAFREGALSNGYEHRCDLSRGQRLSIERINPNGDYCPQNCEWITGSENSRRMAVSQRAKEVSHLH